MTSGQKELAARMREISQRAFNAEWMDGLEYALWRIATAGGGRYGQITIDRGEARSLIRMAGVTESWIVTDEAGAERAVTLGEWMLLFADSAYMSAA